MSNVLNHKRILFDKCVAAKIPAPVYKLITKRGKSYQSQVTVNKNAFITPTAKETKRESEQEAARVALLVLKDLFPEEPIEEAVASSSSSSISDVAQLLPDIPESLLSDTSSKSISENLSSLQCNFDESILTFSSSISTPCMRSDIFTAINSDDDVYEKCTDSIYLVDLEYLYRSRQLRSYYKYTAVCNCYSFTRKKMSKLFRKLRPDYILPGDSEHDVEMCMMLVALKYISNNHDIEITLITNSKLLREFSLSINATYNTKVWLLDRFTKT